MLEMSANRVRVLFQAQLCGVSIGEMVGFFFFFFKADVQWKRVFVTEAKGGVFGGVEPKNKVSWVNPTFESSVRH